VALATGVSSVDQITDASSYNFTTEVSYYIGPVLDAAHTGGLNSFIILKDSVNDYYGVVRIDDVFRYAIPIDHGVYGTSYSGLNATWWFQPDGSGNFAPVPEPATLAMVGLGLLAVTLNRRRA
jgi:hypothetical protein